MGRLHVRARKWLSRLVVVMIVVNLLLVYQGVVADFASQLGNVTTSTQRSLGMSFGPSPVQETRWAGITKVRPDGPAAVAGLRPGDGVKFDKLLGEEIVWQPGENVAVTVDRDGHRFRATLTALPPPPASAKDSLDTIDWLALFLEPIMAAFATLLLVRGLRNRAAALLGLSVLFWLDPELAFVPHWAYVPLLLFVALPVRAGCFYAWPIFALEISGGGSSGRQSMLVRRGAAVLAVLCLVSLFLFELMVPLPIRPQFGMIITYVADLALGLAVIVLNYRRNDPAGRNRIKIVFAAFGCVFLGICAALVVRLFGRFPEVTTWIILSCLGIALGLLSYAVLNRKLFDFGFAVNRTLVFGGVTFVLLASFGLLEWSVEHFTPAAWRAGGPYISAAIAVGLFLAFHRVRDWIERHIERLFFSSWHRAEAALRRFVESAGHFDRMAKLCSTFVEALASYAQGADAALYLRERDGAYRLEAGKLAGAKQAYADDDPVFALMRGERRPIDLSQVNGAIPGSLALPMLDQGMLVGFVLLGAKPDGAGYRPDEIENLGWAAHQVGLDLRALHARLMEEQVVTLTNRNAALSAVLDRLQPLAGQT